MGDNSRLRFLAALEHLDVPALIAELSLASGNRYRPRSGRPDCTVAPP